MTATRRRACELPFRFEIPAQSQQLPPEALDSLLQVRRRADRLGCSSPSIMTSTRFRGTARSTSSVTRGSREWTCMTTPLILFDPKLAGYVQRCQWHRLSPSAESTAGSE